MVFASQKIDRKELEKLSGYPNLLKTLLVNRGIFGKNEAEAFLYPDYERDTHDSFLLPDIDKAIARILQAIDKNEKIVIYSDYDADGIPGGVILYDFFKKINYKNFINYIPHRHLEGFGLNQEAIDKFKEDNINLIITVDCGISDIKEVSLAKKYNIDTIITDHHLPSSTLPDAVAIVDPKRVDSKYPFPDLCGAGVAFKLIQALIIKISNFSFINFVPNKINKGWEKWLLDMVGIATLSDMVPLINENRTLAFFGLKVLQKSPRLGLRKLLSLLKIEQKNINEDDIGFSISPRINAASRMGNPEDAFKLFTVTDEVEADICVRHLDHINNERKGVVASMVKEVRKIMKKRYEEINEESKVIVIGNPDWRPSLLGLVANSLVDDHKCPVFLWGRDGGNVLKGSCRGDGKVSVVDLMTAVGLDIFNDFGGHMMSGGFSVIQEKVYLLEEKLNVAYKKISSQILVREVDILADTTITIDEVNFDNYRILKKMSPFGTNNPKPIFLFEGVVIEGAKMFGKDVNHLELIFKNSSNKNIKVIGFFMNINNWGRELKKGSKINLLANFEHSTFRGFSELRLRIVDIEIVL